jgi:hypothetical protein
MGQATRTTKLLLDLGERRQGGTNTGKRTFLDETVAVLNAARAFYIDFLLAHAQKLVERVSYYSETHLEMRERAISANELLTWAEACTVETREHPHPWAGWNFSERFPDMPFIYRRSVIKDAIGKARSFLAQRENWQKSGKKRGKPGLPGASDYPTLYKRDQGEEGQRQQARSRPGHDRHRSECEESRGDHSASAWQHPGNGLPDRPWP